MSDASSTCNMIMDDILEWFKSYCIQEKNCKYVKYEQKFRPQPAKPALVLKPNE